MRRHLMCGVAAVAITVAMGGPLTAADMPIKARPAPPMIPVCEWCGFYFGGHLGYGWSRHSLGSDPTGVGNRLSGLAVGLHAGYNWQYGAVVLGIEGDGTITPWEKTWTEPGGAQDTQTQRKIDWLASVRGRIGWAFDRNLIYATGGVAWIGANTTQNSSNSFKSVRFTSTGGVVGGGIERKLTQNVSARVEGLYYIFNKTQTFHVADGSSGESSTLTDKLRNVTVIRAGVSWHLPP